MKTNFPKRIFSLILLAIFLLSFPAGGLAEDTARMDAAKAFVETVLEHGRYIEGSAYPELIVMGLNSDTLEPVKWKWSNNTYYPANFFTQQNFLRTLVGLTNLTGNPEYKEIAKKQMKLWLEKLTDKNGLLYAGAHTFVDVKTGEVVTTGDHEMKNNSPYYELMYEVDPEATVKYMEAFWNAHILDWSNLAMNRHGAYDKEMSSLWDSDYTDTSIDFKQDGVAFQSTGNDLIEFAFFISEKTGDGRPEEWALKLLQKYIDVADPVTGLSGAQYGELLTGDRVYLQFGEEFGEKAKEYNYVDRGTVATTAGATPRVLLSYYEKLPEEEKTEKKYILDYAVKSVEGVAKYVYDAENHRLKTPMFSDGTSLTGYELQRNGYHGNKGNKLPDYQALDGSLMSTAIYVYKFSESEIVWQFARDLAKGYKLGDIGNSPGVGVSLNMSTTARDGQSLSVMIELYKLTGVEDYLTLAEKIGQNILTRETRNNNMFLKNNSRFNAKVSDSNALALLQLEAALQGKFDVIPKGGSGGGIDMYHDGVGRTTCGNMIFSKTRVGVESVSLEKKNITLILNNCVSFTDISGHSAEKEIKQMASLGAVTGRKNGAFSPDENIECGEFVHWCARLCGLDSEKLIDNSITADAVMKKEEMSAIVVKALINKNPQNEYKACGALAQFADSADVSDRVKNYADIAANYYLVNERGDKYFYPEQAVTRAEAAVTLKRLSDLCDVGAIALNSSILPVDASVQSVSYTNSSPDVVEIDENGRLFPLSCGNAVITVTAGGVADTCNISVVPYESWMLKSIEVDGVLIDEFSSVKTKYDHKLLIGTTEPPTVNASSYSGEEVTVIMPKTLPGVVKLYAEGESDNPYTVSLISEKINYVANESFDTFPVGAIPHSVTNGKAMWYLHSNGWENGYAPVKIAEHPTETGVGNNAVAIPYKGRVMEFSARFHDTPYITGENAEDGSIVVEYDLMPESEFDGFEIRLLDYDPATRDSTRIMRIIYTEDSITYRGADIGNYTPGKMHSVKIVLDKKTLNMDIYLNGDKALSAQAPERTAKELDTLRFRAPADLQVADDTMVYIDNVKIYDLPADKEATTVFYNTDGNKVTRIGDDTLLSFQAEMSDVADGTEVSVVYAEYSPEGTLRQAEIKEVKVGETKSKMLVASIGIDDMKVGDYLCVYVWTKELCPLIRQTFIYKC